MCCVLRTHIAWQSGQSPLQHWSFPHILIWRANLLNELEGRSTVLLAGIQHAAVTVGSVYKPSLGEHVLRSLTCLIFSPIGQDGWEGHFILSLSELSRTTVKPSAKKHWRQSQRARHCPRHWGVKRQTWSQLSFVWSIIYWDMEPQS